MRRSFSVAAALLFFAAAAPSVHGQGLPKLQTDANISEGVFPNGMHWFVAANSAEKGSADFALVYRHSAGDTAYVDISRRILSSGGRIRGRSLQKFMSSNAVAPSMDGYARCTDDAVVFRFADVLLPRKEDLTDSLLLAVFGVAEELACGAADVGSGLHLPLEDMAVIVAGDVKPAEISAKMRTFSLMVPKNSTAAQTPAGSAPGPSQEAVADVADVAGVAGVQAQPDGAGAAGNPGSTAEERPEGRPERHTVRICVDTVGALCRIEALAVFPRMPREKMATTQFAVMDKMTETFSAIAGRRIGDALNDAKIPFADLSVSHISAAGNSGDESVKISFCTLPETADSALVCFGEALGALNGGQIHLSDIEFSNRAYAGKCRKAASARVTNAEYLQICENAFLYGAPLGTDRQLCAFCQSKVLPDTLQLRLMRGFADALLRSPDDSSAFTAGWKDGRVFPERRPAMADTLLLPDRTEKKAKMKSVRTEPMSGGEIWTWQNGLKVYYKRVPGEKMLQWALTVNRGYSSSETLQPGEAAFIPDIFKLCSVSGISNRDLRDILAAEGISLDADVSLYSTTLRGSAEPGSLELLLKLLAGMFSERKTDPDALAEYLSGMPVRKELAAGGRSARIAAIDSLICADNPYSGIRMYGNFTDSTVRKAENLLDDIFSGSGDGFIVLSGDMDSSVLKKTVSFYADRLPLSQASSRVPRVRFSPVSGWSSHSRTGDKESIDVLLSTALPMNAENLCTSRLAARLLEDCLKDCLTGMGFHTKVSSEFVMFPQERFNVLISLDRVPDKGFAYGSLDDTAILSALARLREGIAKASVTEWPEAVLAALKAALNNEHSLSTASASWWTDMLTVRYSTGRDFNTKIEEKMNAVTAANVRSLLEKLESGSRIELVVTK